MDKPLREKAHFLQALFLNLFDSLEAEFALLGAFLTETLGPSGRSFINRCRPPRGGVALEKCYEHFTNSAS